jgi:cation:H+ antiporter
MGSVILNIGFVLAGLLGLFLGGNWLVDGASRIARAIGVPPLIVGLTVVSFGTSAPELMVSVRAAMTSSSGIALGNVVGSNIANVGLILGMTGLIAPIAVRVSLVRREIPIMIAISTLAYFLILDSQVGRLDGVLLLAGFVVFNLAMLYITLHRTAEQRAADDAADKFPEQGEINLLLEWGRLILGIAVLLAGAEFTVRGATAIAQTLGVPEVVIGLTLVAFGTSLPELAASMIAAFRGQSDIAIGNVIGSNIANLLLILGMTSVIQPITIQEPGGFSPYVRGMLSFDYPLMLAFALLVLPFTLDRVLNRIEAAFFLMVYASFITASFVVG